MVERMATKQISRFLNPFYFSFLLWLMCLVGYVASWSDLCRPLDEQLLFFITFMLFSLLFFGFLHSRLTPSFTKPDCVDSNTLCMTIAISLVLFAGMVFKKSIPLLKVGGGEAYNSDAVGIPYIGAFATSLALFHGFRLSRLFFVTKNRKYLLEYSLIFLPLLLMLQRQNLIFSFVGLFYAWLSSNKRKNLSILQLIGIVLLMAAVVIIGLFIFGVIGNVRYGIWDWDDSSMISAVGYLNSRYPAWLPREYFWTYIYLVSPLANLNNNICFVAVLNNVPYLIAQFIPSSISKIFGYVADPTYLFQPSLNVSTAFVQPFHAMGTMGMLIYLLVNQSILLLISRYRGLDASLAFACNASVCYFLLMMLFDNPSTYLTTAYLLLICEFVCLWDFIKRHWRKTA